MGIVTLISGAAIQIFDIGLGPGRPAPLGEPEVSRRAMRSGADSLLFRRALFDFFAARGLSCVAAFA